MKIYSCDAARVYLDDCLALMGRMKDNTFDSIVTDPPYGIKFMNKNWDHGVPGVPFWIEALRVAKPGAHLLAFGGTRTYHRLVCAIEDAGWDIRDCIQWIFGSGFPKSANISKHIDKAARGVPQGGSDPTSAAHGKFKGGCSENTSGRGFGAGPRQFMHEQIVGVEKRELVAEAHQWDGWGTALKPAYEPIVVARKPFVGTVAANVLMHSTGALNIDGCRIPSDTQHKEKCKSVVGIDSNRNGKCYGEWSGSRKDSYMPQGRWPANIAHDGSDEVLAGFPESSTTGKRKDKLLPYKSTGIGINPHTRFDHAGAEYTDSGSAARFFYCAKASKKERTCDGQVDNTHPTVKPLSLMCWLVRLVTRKGGLILDPFTGSGTTGVAAIEEEMRFVGIEKDKESAETAKNRIEFAWLEKSKGNK